MATVPIKVNRSRELIRNVVQGMSIMLESLVYKQILSDIYVKAIMDTAIPLDGKDSQSRSSEKRLILRAAPDCGFYHSLCRSVDQLDLF